MDTKTALKVGAIAGLISALFPSVPTIISFNYWRSPWFWLWCAIGVGLIAMAVML